jgi:hypothetical protein
MLDTVSLPVLGCRVGPRRVELVLRELSVAEQRHRALLAVGRLLAIWGLPQRTL